MANETIWPDARRAAEDICDVGRRMYARAFVASNDGNISVRIGENAVLITPSGVSKGDLTPERLFCIDLDGNKIEYNGRVNPEGKCSIETPMHLRVYRENPTVRAVTHAHPAAATAFALARRGLDCSTYPQALVILGPRVPLGYYAHPGTQGIPDSIAPFCRPGKKGEECHSALLANHGALTWGVDVHQAYFRLETLESFAQMTLLTASLGGAVPLTSEECEYLLNV